MLERKGSNDIAIILSLIEKIIESDTVLKAQFKGYSSLSYTLLKQNDPEQYKLPITFKIVSEGQNTIKLITLTFKGAPPKQLKTKTAEDVNFALKLAEIKRKILKQSLISNYRQEFGIEDLYT